MANQFSDGLIYSKACRHSCNSIFCRAAPFGIKLWRGPILKVALVNTALTRGGAARMAANLTQKLCEKGIEATLYHSENRNYTPPFRGLKKNGSRQTNALLARLGGSLWVEDFGLAEDLIKLTASADVLHIHNLHGYYLNYRKLLKTWRNRPIVWTWHDMWGATGRCGSSHECTLWKSGCSYCPNKNLYPSAWIDNAASEFQKRQEIFFELNNLWIVSPSDWMAQIIEIRGFPPERIKVIPNPINANFQFIDQSEARRLLSLPSEDFIALFIASDCGDSGKGYQDFAQALMKTNAMGIAIGKPPPHKYSKIFHTGSIGDPVLLNKYYAAADVMIIPSYADNYPTTVIESLICGTPVIGYAVGGIPSQLSLPYCQIVNRGNIDDLFKALQLQMDVNKKNAQMSWAIASEASDRWSSTTITEPYINLYRSALLVERN
jgi:putative colanic acid biosynthesis glycosyltransferase